MLALNALVAAAYLCCFVVLECNAQRIDFASPELVVELESPEPDNYQVFYDIGYGFREQDSQSWHVAGVQGTSRLLLRLPDGTVKALRIDLGQRPGIVRIRSVVLTTASASLRWDASTHFGRVATSACHDVADVSELNGLLALRATGRDPHCVFSTADASSGPTAQARFLASPTPAPPVQSSGSSIVVDFVSPSADDVLQVFYDRGAGFSEADSASRAYQKASGIVRVELPLPQAAIRALRVDPSIGARRVAIRSITLRTLSGEATWSSAELLRRFPPERRHDVRELKDEHGALLVEPSGGDPQLLIDLSKSP